MARRLVRRPVALFQLLKDKTRRKIAAVANTGFKRTGELRAAIDRRDDTGLIVYLFLSAVGRGAC
jgi:hypothetical protein